MKSTSEEDGKDEPSLGHNAGANCLDCHSQFKISGTVYKDSTASTVQPGSPIALTKPDGGQIILEKTNSDGNFFSAVVEDGPYLIKVADITSRHWHSIPDQGSCNVCHKKGGNGSATRTKVFPTHHTEIPTDNDCAHCHHFPAGMSLEQLETEGALNAATTPPSAPGSRVEIAGRAFSFNPDDYTIATVRPDIFAPGFFSMFDVILAVAARNSIPVTYHFDDSRKSHFIDTINHIAGDYWYHFAYDVGTEQSEITYKRAYRWDEALWRPGVRIRVVEGENLAEIKAADTLKDIFSLCGTTGTFR